MDGEQAFHDRRTVVQPATQLPPPVIARLHDIFKGDGLAGKLLADRSAHKVVLVVDTNLGHVAWVVPDRHILADVGC